MRFETQGLVVTVMDVMEKGSVLMGMVRNHRPYYYTGCVQGGMYKSFCASVIQYMSTLMPLLVNTTNYRN